MVPETHAFDLSTEIFFNAITEAHLKCHMEGYVDRYFIGENYKVAYKCFSITGWKNILNNLVEELEYQLDLGKNDMMYPYKIKIIKFIVDPKKHAVTLLIMDLETECILQSIIKVSIFDRRAFDNPRNIALKPKMSVKVTVRNKAGKIVFKTE